MCTRCSTILLLLFFCLTFGFSQKGKESYGQSIADGESAMKEGDYGKAGDAFLNAWKQKQTKWDALYQAAENFYLARDYVKAADAYTKCANEIKDDYMDLKIGRTLKQSGKPREAIPFFESFIKSYKGKDLLSYQTIVKNDIEGCRMASTSPSLNPAVKILLPDQLNSRLFDFGPIPFGEDLLYFSSTKAGKSKIYRSQYLDGQWTKAEPAKGFPKMEDKHIANGTFGADNKRFYFTICQLPEDVKTGLQTICQIYVMTKKDKGWSEPVPLRDYINVPSTNVTHPFVYTQGKFEVLLFSSNRTGGEGGMDLWYTTRELSSTDIDFTMPVNLGPAVNSPGDELTPFYDPLKNTLFFSSNGKVGYGGMDIFSAQGTNTSWTNVQNLGLPYNSEADDMYYVSTISGQKGFLVSNRAYGDEKKSTRHEDIFTFTTSTTEMVLKGKLLDTESKLPLQETRVYHYLIENEGKKKLINTIVSDDGNYSIVLKSTGTQSIEFEKFEYFPLAWTYVPGSQALSPINKDFELLFKYGEKAKQAQASAQIPIEKTSVPEKAETKEYVTKPVTVPSTTTSTPSTPTPKPAVVNETKTTSTTPVIASTPTKKETTTSAVVSAPKPVETKSASTSSAPSTTSTMQSTASTTSTPVTTRSTNYSNSSKSSIEVNAAPTVSGKYYKGKELEKWPSISSAPVKDGIYYKVQVLSQEIIDPNNSKYDALKKFGRIDTEYVPEKNSKRMLIADFATLETAEYTLSKVKQLGYNNAFVVRYYDGIRLRRWKG